MGVSHNPLGSAAPLSLRLPLPHTGNELNKKFEFLKGCSCLMFSCLLTSEHRQDMYVYRRQIEYFQVHLDMPANKVDMKTSTQKTRHKTGASNICVYVYILLAWHIKMN